MSLFDVLMDGEEGESNVGRMQAIVIGIVTNNEDPDGMGRVKVRFPWLSDADESAWARVATPMAGPNRGLYFLPEVDDEVLIAFEHGDLRFPYVLGALWSGIDAPPCANDGKNNVRIIKSRSGHIIRLNDEEGKETIEIVDKSEKNSIIIDTASNTITMTADKDIVLSAPQGAITLDAKDIILGSSAATEVKAGAGMDIEAGASLNIKGQTVNIN